MGAGDKDSIRSPLVLPRPIYYKNMSQITKPFALVHAGEAELGLLVFMLLSCLVYCKCRLQCKHLKHYNHNKLYLYKNYRRSIVGYLHGRQKI